MTIGLYKQPHQGAIGEVIGSRETSHQEIEIDQAQAWSYPADRLIGSRECFLNRPFSDHQQANTNDPNLAVLWHGFEHFLLAQFLEATQIVTPWHDPEFDHDAYETFLASLGYMPVTKAAYGKPVQHQAQQEEDQL